MKKAVEDHWLTLRCLYVLWIQIIDKVHLLKIFSKCNFFFAFVLYSALHSYSTVSKNSTHDPKPGYDWLTGCGLGGQGAQYVVCFLRL